MSAERPRPIDKLKNIMDDEALKQAAELEKDGDKAQAEMILNGLMELEQNNPLFAPLDESTTPQE